MLGIVIGPDVLGIAESDDFIEFFFQPRPRDAVLLRRLRDRLRAHRGEPLRLGAWRILSLVLAYGIGGALAAAGVVISYLYTGSALATTAIGTLIPILRDTGELRTRFGTYLLAARRRGEFGPILLITLVLSTAQPLHEADPLAFIALALLLALLAVRLAWRGPAARTPLESSSQARGSDRSGARLRPVRARRRAGLDILLGGFVAGMIVRAALGPQSGRSSRS